MTQLGWNMPARAPRLRRPAFRFSGIWDDTPFPTCADRAFAVAASTVCRQLVPLAVKVSMLLSMATRCAVVRVTICRYRAPSHRRPARSTNRNGSSLPASASQRSRSAFCISLADRPSIAPRRNASTTANRNDSTVRLLIWSVNTAARFCALDGWTSWK